MVLLYIALLLAMLHCYTTCYVLTTMMSKSTELILDSINPCIILGGICCYKLWHHKHNNIIPIRCIERPLSLDFFQNIKCTRKSMLAWAFLCRGVLKELFIGHIVLSCCDYTLSTIPKKCD